MLVNSAVELVNQLIFLPGWTITATDHSNRFEGTILVRVDYPARNSNRDQAPDGYPQEIRTYATFPLVVADCDDADVYGAIVEALAEIELHEIREFLRVSPTNWAPFHPHRVDGMRRWAKRTGGDIRHDLKFGIG
jgi:hypothetical protein